MESQMDAQKMWTITEDDNSFVSSSLQSPSRQPASFNTNSEDNSSQENSPIFIEGNNMLSPDYEEDFGPPTEYSQNSFNFFAESPAPSPIIHETKDVFRSERNINDGRKRPQSANQNWRPHHFYSQYPDRAPRPASAENIPIIPPHLKSKGKSSSFGEQESEIVMMPLNDLHEQRKDLDKLPRSKRLVRRMESPVGITLLQLDERDMLVGKDESWQISKNGRVRNLKDMEAVRHSRKNRESQDQAHPSPPRQQRRPLTGHRRTHTPQADQRPLSASPRVQRCEGWQDGKEGRVEWGESEVSGILEDDCEDDVYEGRFEWLPYDNYDEKVSRSSRQPPQPKGVSDHVERLAMLLRRELQRWPLAEIWDRVLDSSRRGFFGLPELVQVLSDAGLSCSLMETEELLNFIAARGGPQSRVSFSQFQRFYCAEKEESGWVQDLTKPSMVSNSELRSLLENLEIRASKLKFPADPLPRKKKAPQQKKNQSRSSTTSIVLI